jgi:hypothetical protein
MAAEHCREQPWARAGKLTKQEVNKASGSGEKSSPVHITTLENKAAFGGRDIKTVEYWKFA